MPYKSRTEPTELQFLRSLFTRMDLSDKDKQHYFNLKKGYEGEVMFDLLTEKLQCECLLLNDLLLRVQNTTFQIDSLIIVSDTIYFFEVKNYDGDYYYELDKLYKKPKFEIMNPFTQLSRSETLLRQLLNNIGSTMSIDASVVFVNPEFTLYQTPLNKPVILPTQLNRYMQKLNNTPSKLNGKHKLLADKLISLHIEGSPFMQNQSYDYDLLRKGITCEECHSFLVTVDGKKCRCKDCGHEEFVTTAVMRSVKEYKLLFPNGKVTTNIIHEWCKVINSKKRIKRILEKNFKIVGVHQWSYYE
jgi:hypothetical protein